MKCSGTCNAVFDATTQTATLTQKWADCDITPTHDATNAKIVFESSVSSTSPQYEHVTDSGTPIKIWLTR